MDEMIEWGGSLNRFVNGKVRNIAEILNESTCNEVGHMWTWMPKNQSLCMRCGAWNSISNVNNFHAPTHGCKVREKMTQI